MSCISNSRPVDDWQSLGRSLPYRLSRLAGGRSLSLSLSHAIYTVCWLARRRRCCHTMISNGPNLPRPPKLRTCQQVSCRRQSSREFFSMREMLCHAPHSSHHIDPPPTRCLQLAAMLQAASGLHHPRQAAPLVALPMPWWRRRRHRCRHPNSGIIGLSPPRRIAAALLPPRTEETVLPEVLYISSCRPCARAGRRGPRTARRGSCCGRCSPAQPAAALLEKLATAICSAVIAGPETYAWECDVLRQETPSTVRWQQPDTSDVALHRLSSCRN